MGKPFLGGLNGSQPLRRGSPRGFPVKRTLREPTPAEGPAGGPEGAPMVNPTGVQPVLEGRTSNSGGGSWHNAKEQLGAGSAASWTPRPTAGSVICTGQSRRTRPREAERLRKRRRNGGISSPSWSLEPWPPGSSSSSVLSGGGSRDCRCAHSGNREGRRTRGPGRNPPNRLLFRQPSAGRAHDSFHGHHGCAQR